MKPVDGWILDFDGTLASQVPEAAIAELSATLSAWRAVPEVHLRQYFRSVSAYPMAAALRLLLDALGLAERFDEVALALESTQGRGWWCLDVEPEALAFLTARRQGTVKVFSAAGAKAPRFRPVVDLLGAEAFLSYPHASKANPDTWRHLATERGWNAARWVVVDDSPLALWAAKSAGFLTVMRLNSVFGESDYQAYRDSIDFRVSSLSELGARIRSAGHSERG